MSLYGRYNDLHDTFDTLCDVFPINREPSRAELAEILTRCRQLAQGANGLAAAIESGEEYEA